MRLLVFAGLAAWSLMLCTTAAVADINRDGHLDIVSGESWYEAPTWKKHALREINFTSGYIDNFSDLPLG